MTAATAPLRPRTTADVAAIVADAAERHAPLRIVGRGHWLDAGGPPPDDTTPLAVDALSGIVAYTPGDLTLTARAATPLATIAAVTAEHGQWLALDPFGSPDGTLGATVATASAGPLAHTFGTPRDATLGIEAVTGTGAVIRSGGRVVKNVAGFDLTRLFTGAWGTLGVLTEITVRLRARPPVDETWAVAVPAGGAALDALCAATRAAPIAPLALELLDARLAADVGLGERDVLLVRLGGGPDAVSAQRTAVQTLGLTESVSTTVWDALRGIEPPGAAVARVSDLPARLADCWRLAGEVGGAAPIRRHASVGRGVVRVIAAAGDAPAVAALIHAARAGGDAGGPTVIAERLPRTAGPAPWSVPNAALARRVKQAFDPAGVLNPGLLGLDS